MKIMHRVTFSKKDGVDSLLDGMNIKYKKTPVFENYLITFELDESDTRWSQIEELVKNKNALDLCNTIFTKEEILEAEWSRLVTVNERGYPQPEGTWVRNPINYGIYCHQCGIYEQTASFRIKQEPALGKYEFMTLFWTYAIFATPTVFQTLQSSKIQGYEVWDVLIHQTNMASKKISQLFTPHVIASSLQSKELEQLICPQCGTTKHPPYNRGVMYLQRDAMVDNLDIIQTHEWFGDGGRAYREVLVSNRVAKLIMDNNWHGVQLKAVGLV